MRVVSFDTETYLIRSSGKATTNSCPRMVCAQYQIWDTDTDESLEPELYLREEGVDRFLELMRADDTIFVALNMPFDATVMARAVWEETGQDILGELFDMYDNNRMYDCAVRAKLHDIQRGGRWGAYSLSMLVKRYLGVDLADKTGDDVWRLRYAELDGVPVDVWPQRAVDYAKADVIWTLRLFQKLDAISPEEFQCAADFWLRLTSLRGLKVDVAWAERLDAYYAQESEEWWRVLRENGMTDGDTLPRAKKQELVKRAWEEVGEEPWLTPSGLLKTSKEVFTYLEKQGVEEPLFDAYSNYSRANKFRTTYLEPVLDAEGHSLISRFDVLKNTSRISSSGPNTQNIPSRLNNREIERLKKDPNAVVGPDIRGCFVPREGHAYIGCDYSAMELACLSQYIYSHTGKMGRMGLAINDNKDLHSLAASSILRISYEEAMFRKAVGKEGKSWEKACEHVSERYGVTESDINAWAADGKESYIRNECKSFGRWRAVSKISNFSFPVGANAKTFSKQVRNSGLEFSDSEGEYVRDQWYQAWPEMNEYQLLIQSFSTRQDHYPIPLLGPHNMLRGWMTSTADRPAAGANYAFQSLGAFAILLAGYKISHETFTDEDSPLFGSHIVLCVHDELVTETPVEKAEKAVVRLAERMVQWAKVFLPDIRVSAEADIMYDRWSKDGGDITTKRSQL